MTRAKKLKCYPLDTAMKNWISEYWDEYKDARKEKMKKEGLEIIVLRVSKGFAEEFGTAPNEYDSVVKAVRHELQAHSKLRNRSTAAGPCRSKAKSAAELYIDDHPAEFEELIEREKEARDTPRDRLFTLHSIVKGKILDDKPKEVVEKYTALAKERKVHPENIPYDEVRERADRSATKELNEIILYFWTHYKVHLAVMSSRISEDKGNKPTVEVGLFETSDIVTDFETVLDHVGGIEELTMDTYGKFADELFQERLERIREKRGKGEEEEVEEEPSMSKRKGVTTFERVPLEEDDNGWPLLPVHFDDAHRACPGKISKAAWKRRLLRTYLNKCYHLASGSNASVPWKALHDPETATALIDEEYLPSDRVILWTDVEHLRIGDITALLSHIAFRQRDPAAICAFQFKAYLDDGTVTPAVRTISKKGKQPAAGQRNKGKERVTVAGGSGSRMGKGKAAEADVDEGALDAGSVGKAKKGGRPTKKATSKAKSARAPVTRRRLDSDEDDEESVDGGIGGDEEEYLPAGNPSADVAPSMRPTEVLISAPAVTGNARPDVKYLQWMAEMNTSPYEFSTSATQRYKFLRSLCDHQHYRILVTGLEEARHEGFNLNDNPLGISNFAWWDRREPRLPAHTHTPAGAVDVAHFLLKYGNFTKAGQCKYPPEPAEALVLLSGLMWRECQLVLRMARERDAAAGDDHWYLSTSIPTEPLVQSVLPEFWRGLLVGLGALVHMPSTLDRTPEGVRKLLFPSAHVNTPPLSVAVDAPPIPSSVAENSSDSNNAAGPSKGTPSAERMSLPEAPLTKPSQPVQSSALDGHRLSPSAGPSQRQLPAAPQASSSSNLPVIEEEVETSSFIGRSGGIQPTTAKSFGGFMPRPVGPAGQSIPFTNGKEFLYENPTTTATTQSDPADKMSRTHIDNAETTAQAKDITRDAEAQQTVRRTKRVPVPKVIFDPSHSPPTRSTRKRKQAGAESDAEDSNASPAKRARHTSKPPSQAKPRSATSKPPSRKPRSSAA
ncbi:hypothetical protein BXZ70DRAFT_910336 [Cristinia sonorae]|uniref:Uncharacterized protein n=1 Tax=Cristinia sonorae TaxID=1940300 RepID=A0A8K0XLJ4_9AGAR|nr:hypothetical protein BXZ70DRAFT_910336 [Cristinia sonorae]